MTRCKSTILEGGKLVRCTRDAGHPVSETNEGRTSELHRNFTPGHKIKWPESAAYHDPDGFEQELDRIAHIFEHGEFPPIRCEETESGGWQCELVDHPENPDGHFIKFPEDAPHPLDYHAAIAEYKKRVRTTKAIALVREQHRSKA